MDSLVIGPVYLDIRLSIFWSFFFTFSLMCFLYNLFLDSILLWVLVMTGLYWSLLKAKRKASSWFRDFSFFICLLWASCMSRLFISLESAPNRFEFDNLLPGLSILSTVIYFFISCPIYFSSFLIIYATSFISMNKIKEWWWTFFIIFHYSIIRYSFFF